MTSLAARRTCPRLGDCCLLRLPAPVASFFQEVSMAKRQTKSSRPTKSSARRGKPHKIVSDDLHITHPHAAGIDVHSREHWVAVPANSVSHPPRDQLPAHVRKFGTCTADLELLADWLTECGI